MEIRKESLANKIIPSIFYDKDGKKIIDSVQQGLDNNNLSKDIILNKFKRLENYKDEAFWRFFVTFFNECFASNILVNVSDDPSFEFMIKSILEARFDHIFVEDDSMKVINDGILRQYLAENYGSKDNTLDLSCGDCYRLVVPYLKKYSVNVGYHEPKDLDEFPNNLIKIEGDKLSVNIHSKKNRDSFFKNIKDHASELETPIIEEFSTEKLDSLNIDVHSFFPSLRDSGLFIKKVKFCNSTLYFNVGLKDLIDFDALVDSDYFLNSKMDLLFFQNIEFIYSTLIGDKGYDFKFKVQISLKDLGGNKYVKFMIYYYTDTHLTEDIKTKIGHIFAENGLHFNHSYELPEEYYVNNIIMGGQSFKSDYEKLMQLDSENITLKKLIDKEVLNISDEITLDSEKLRTFKNEILSELNEQTTSIYQSEYKVQGVSIDSKKRQTLTVRVIKNDDVAIYKVIIYHDVRDYDKITSIVLPHINYSYVINQILNNNKEQALQDICKMIDIYLRNKYNLVLEKEANNSCNFLNNYCNCWQEIDSKITPQKAGDKVEKHLNVLLKFIYRNYLLLGGQYAPDGYLSLNRENYILDSKQHTSISQGEYDKVVRYIFTYALKNGLASTNNGTFIVCRGKIGKSLNINARKTWLNCPQFNSQYRLSFITIEYFLRVFEYIKDSKVKSNPELLNKIYNSFNTIILASGIINDSRELIEQENTMLDEISSSIREFGYTPRRKNQL